MIARLFQYQLAAGVYIVSAARKQTSTSMCVTRRTSSRQRVKHIVYS